MKSNKRTWVITALLALALVAALLLPVAFHSPALSENPISYIPEQLLPQQIAVAADEDTPPVSEPVSEPETTTAAEPPETETTVPATEEPTTEAEPTTEETTATEPTMEPVSRQPVEPVPRVRSTEPDGTEKNSSPAVEGVVKTNDPERPSAATGNQNDKPSGQTANGPGNETTTGDGKGTDSPKPESKADVGDKSETGKPEETSGSTPEKPTEKETASLITDLRTGTILRTELQNDVLPFYVYYSDASVKADIRVNLNHKAAGANTSFQGNGMVLPPDGIHYKAVLELGVNKITISYTDATGARRSASFLITYKEALADADHPTVGEAPPVIKTNLDTWTGNIKTSSFTFIVGAFTEAGTPLSMSDSFEGIEVFLDGERIGETTGSRGQYEYVLPFTRPNVGDTETHTVSVRAWDKDGNSRYSEYTVTYEAFDEGEVIGTVHMVIDATVVGLGILDEFDYEIIQGEPAAATILAMLEEFGYEPVYDGTVSVGFYLRKISRSDCFTGAEIDERLLPLIERDGIRLTEPCDRDSLGEYDFTSGSGWMFAVNDVYPGKGLSYFYLNDEDVISLRFTLAYGKDIGGYLLAGNGYGSLSSYCGIWANEEYTPLAHDYVETGHVDASPDTAGFTEYTCTRCGDSYREEIPYESGE